MRLNMIMMKIFLALFLNNLSCLTWASSSDYPFETWQIKEPLCWQDAMSKLSVKETMGELELPWCLSDERAPVLEQAVSENWSLRDCQRAMMLAQPYATSAYSLTSITHLITSTIPPQKYDACMVFAQTTAPVCKVVYLKQDAEGTYRCAAQQVYQRAEKSSSASWPIFKDYQLLELQSPYGELEGTENLPLILHCLDELPNELHAAALQCIKQHPKVFKFVSSLEYVKVNRLILPEQEEGTQHYLLSCDVGSGLYCPLSCILHFNLQGQCRLGEYFGYSRDHAANDPRYLQDGKLIKIYNESGKLLEILNTTH